MWFYALFYQLCAFVPMCLINFYKLDFNAAYKSGIIIS
jgi:hypothetical protein